MVKVGRFARDAGKSGQFVRQRRSSVLLGFLVKTILGVLAHATIAPLDEKFAFHGAANRSGARTHRSVHRALDCACEPLEDALRSHHRRVQARLDALQQVRT